MRALFILIVTSFCLLASERKVKYQIEINIDVPKQTSRVDFTLNIPKTIKGRQEVKLNFSKKPDKIFDNGDARYAIWQMASLKKQNKLTIDVDAKLHLYQLKNMKKNGAVLNAVDKKTYLAQEKWLEKNHEKILALAKKVKDGKSPLETAENILKLVCKELKYEGYVVKDQGALLTLEKGTGDCTDYTDLFVTLCRVKGIPARFISGVVTSWRDDDTPKHNRAEFFIEGLGWIPVDPLWTDLKKASIKEVGNSFLWLSGKRNDENLGGYSFWYYRYFGSPVKVSASIRLLSDSKQKKLPNKAVY